MIETYREKKTKDTDYRTNLALCEQIITLAREVIELAGHDIPITCVDGRGHEGFLDSILAKN